LDMGVLVEKPLATNLVETEVLRKATKEIDSPVFVACCLRFDPGLRRFREMLPEVGEIHTVHAECRSYLPDWRPGRDFRDSYSARAGEGGVLRDLIHEVDYALWLFGIPGEVFGRLRNTGRLGIEAEEAADALWTTQESVRVGVELDYLTRTPVRRLRAAGDRGELELDFIGRRLAFQGPGAKARVETVECDRFSMYDGQAAAFLDAVLKKDPGDLATLEEGLEALAVCDALRKSSSSGRLERVLT